MWKQWIEMAQESQRAAIQAEAISPRSAVSRHYYSAYQAMTALLHRRGLHPPENREAWNHAGNGGTPELVKNELGTLIISRDKRKDMAERLAHLYTVRVLADYHTQDDLATKSSLVRKDAGFLVTIAVDVLLGGR